MEKNKQQTNKTHTHKSEVQGEKQANQKSANVYQGVVKQNNDKIYLAISESFYDNKFIENRRYR